MFSTEPASDSAPVSTPRGATLVASRAVRRLVALSIAFLGTCLGTAAFADSRDQPKSELDRWVPAVAVEISVYGHTGKGNLSGTTITGPRANIGPIQAQIFGDFPDDRLVDARNSREEILSVLFGANFEIMSPRLIEGIGAPRLFMDMTVSGTQTLDVRLARDAAPGELAIPEIQMGALTGETAILGRGSQITVQHDDPQVRAGIGVAFTKQFEFLTMRIKPSFTYTRAPLKIKTITRRAVRLDRAPFDTSPWEIDDPNDYRLIQFDETVDEVYHGAGVALELEFLTGERAGPIEPSLYVKGGATRFWGDMTTNVTETNPDYPGEQVFYKFTQDRWAYRAALGVRLRFVPDDRRRRR